MLVLKLKPDVTRCIRVTKDGEVLDIYLVQLGGTYVKLGFDGPAGFDITRVPNDGNWTVERPGR